MLHENEYCKGPGNPANIAKRKAVEEKQRLCEHKNTETAYSYIPGECMQEPDYDVCIDCGAKC